MVEGTLPRSMVNSYHSLDKLVAGFPLLILPVAVLYWGFGLPAWLFMWLIAGAIFLGCKWLALFDSLRDVSHIPKGRAFEFLFLWPGMDARSFVLGDKFSSSLGAGDWFMALLKTLLGIFLFFVVPRFLPNSHLLVVGWVGMMGLIFLLHFGGFELLSLFWKAKGIRAEPLMEAPVFSCSLSEFWGKRWNRGFRELGHRFIFQPLRPFLGVGLAGFSVFLVSGLVHDLVISVPARGGYGLPTAYFVFQGLGVALERSKWGKRTGLDRGIKGWLMMAIWTAVPAYFLFHPPFVLKVIVPMMQALGAYP